MTTGRINQISCVHYRQRQTSVTEATSVFKSPDEHKFNGVPRQAFPVASRLTTRHKRFLAVWSMISVVSSHVWTPFAPACKRRAPLHQGDPPRRYLTWSLTFPTRIDKPSSAKQPPSNDKQANRGPQCIGTALSGQTVLDAVLGQSRHTLRPTDSDRKTPACKRRAPPERETRPVGF